MVNYTCNNCNKHFKQKSHYDDHTKNKKYPCIITSSHSPPNLLPTSSQLPPSSSQLPPEQKKVILQLKSENTICKYCYKEFTRVDNLKRHIKNNKCSVLKLQKQQKENIFTNLINNEKIEEETNKEINSLDVIQYNSNKIENKADNDILLKIMKKLEDQEKENQEIRKKMEEKEKILIKKYEDLEKNNIDLQKSNLELQKKMNKIIIKNQKIKYVNNNSNNNSNNQNIQINNNHIKLVCFGKEDFDKIDYKVYVEAMKKTGPLLYQKTVEGIHFNPEYPEYQNIYISDVNREKVMKYSDEKWILDNWNTIYPELLGKVIEFGYSKEEFMNDLYQNGKIKSGIEIIRNGMRWIKLLDDNAPDVEYFNQDEEDREEIDEKTLKEYKDMQEFRRKHPKIEIEKRIKNKIKNTLYNKKELPIENYKKIDFNFNNNLLEKVN